MANDFEIKALDRETGSGGRQPSAQGGHHRREQRLRALLVALKTGPIDAARLAFTALVDHDQELSHHPWLTQIGSALQSSNLSAALRLARDMQAGPHPAFKNLSLQVRVSDPVLPHGPAHSGFIGGLTGRLFDLSA